MSGPGPVPTYVKNLPSGWEAFLTIDPTRYFCFPQTYYYCRAKNKVQWDQPDEGEALPPYTGPLLNGKKPYEMGDEFIPNPPPPKEYTGQWSDGVYKCSCENEDDLFEPDEALLDACVNCGFQAVKDALADGADASVPSWPWENTPLHLACAPPHWNEPTFKAEHQARLELVQHLIRQGADMDVENTYHMKPVDLAAVHGYQRIVAEFNQQGCELGWFGAAFLGDFERIKTLLAEGQIDIDQKGRYGRTAFAEAHLRGHWEVESFLVQQGCSREIPHDEFLKFNPGGAAIPGEIKPKREKQHHRFEGEEWYDDMMEKRFPGYLAQRGQK